MTYNPSGLLNLGLGDWGNNQHSALSSLTDVIGVRVIEPATPQPILPAKEELAEEKRRSDISESRDKHKSSCKQRISKAMGRKRMGFDRLSKKCGVNSEKIENWMKKDEFLHLNEYFDICVALGLRVS